MTQMDVQPVETGGPAHGLDGREHGVPPIVEMHDISITFGGVPALTGSTCGSSRARCTP